MSLQTPPRAPNRRWLLVPVIVAAFALAYALAGFLLVPWIAGRELPRFVEQQLHHRARIGEISFNPFTLRLHAREFALETMEGRPVLGFTDAVVGPPNGIRCCAAPGCWTKCGWSIPRCTWKSRRTAG